MHNINNPDIYMYVENIIIFAAKYCQYCICKNNFKEHVAKICLAPTHLTGVFTFSESSILLIRRLGGQHCIEQSKPINERSLPINYYIIAPIIFASVNISVNFFYIGFYLIRNYFEVKNSHFFPISPLPSPMIKAM